LTLSPLRLDARQQLFEVHILWPRIEIAGEPHRAQLRVQHQCIDPIPVRLVSHPLLDQGPEIKMAHNAFHDLKAVESSLEIDRRRVFPYFGTESGDLLRLFALYGNLVLSKALAVLGHAELFEPVPDLLHCGAASHSPSGEHI
jgi:hypothetical protein